MARRWQHLGVGDDAVTIDVRDQGDESVVTVAGELDALTSRELADVLRPLADKGTHVSVDLRGVDFIDSSGLRCLILTRSAAIAKQGTLLVTAMSEPVERVLEITGTLALLTGTYPADG